MNHTQSTVAMRVVDIKKKVTHILAFTIAQFLSKPGEKYEPHDVEVNSFELSLNGEKYAGGSYYINDENHLVLASVTPQRDLGSTQNEKELITNLKKLRNK